VEWGWDGGIGQESDQEELSLIVNIGMRFGVCEGGGEGYNQSLYANAGTQAENSLSSVRVVLLVALSIITFILFFFFYNPLMWSMNTENKRTSALLLMVPPEVMDQMQELQRYFESMLQNSVELY
jgi:hypothetical protein